MEEQQPLAQSSSITQHARAAGDSIERSTKRIEAGAVEQIRGVRARLQESVDNRRSQTVSRAQSVGSALRFASENVQSDDPVVRDVLDYAGESMEKVARYLSRVDAENLREDVESFARRRPGVFFGGALLLGLAAGRILKAATAQNIEQAEREAQGDARPMLGAGAQVVQGGAP